MRQTVRKRVQVILNTYTVNSNRVDRLIALIDAIAYRNFVNGLIVRLLVSAIICTVTNLTT